VVVFKGGKMKVQLGSGRIVFLVGRYAFKFPRPGCLLKVAKAIPKFAIKGEWKKISNVTKWAWYIFCKGIHQNTTEYRCWRRCRASFLVPTYFTLGGMVNIQKLESGQVPSWDEILSLFQAIAAMTENQVRRVDPHCFEPQNFLKNQDGMRILDYGDGSDQPLRFTDFILRWHKELAIVLGKTPPA